MAEMTPLRRRMIEDMQVRNLSPVTQPCYVHAVARFARHFDRSPDRLGLAEIRAYQIHLTTTAYRGRASMSPSVPCAFTVSRSAAPRWSIASPTRASSDNCQLS